MWTCGDFVLLLGICSCFKLGVWVIALFCGVSDLGFGFMCLFFGYLIMSVFVCLAFWVCFLLGSYSFGFVGVWFCVVFFVGGNVVLGLSVAMLGLWVSAFELLINLCYLFVGTTLGC